MRERGPCFPRPAALQPKRANLKIHLLGLNPTIVFERVFRRLFAIRTILRSLNHPIKFRASSRLYRPHFHPPPRLPLATTSQNANLSSPSRQTKTRPSRTTARRRILRILPQIPSPPRARTTTESERERAVLWSEIQRQSFSKMVPAFIDGREAVFRADDGGVGSGGVL